MSDRISQDWRGSGVKPEMAMLHESQQCLNGMLHKMAYIPYLLQDQNIASFFEDLRCVLKRLNEIEELLKAKKF